MAGGDSADQWRLKKHSQPKLRQGDEHKFLLTLDEHKFVQVTAIFNLAHFVSYSE